MTEGIENSRTKTQTRAFGSPSRYYQGRGELKNIGVYITRLGEKAAVIIDGFLFESLSADITSSIDEGVEVDFFRFGGECSEKEIDGFSDFVHRKRANVVIGIGGGKTIDVAKAAAFKNDAKLIVCPSAASTDSATSSLSVVYTDEGVHSHCRYYKTNPDIVLVDTDIIRKAPVRLLVSGMGDAIATYYEAMSNVRSDSANYIGTGYRRTRMSIAVAELCLELIRENGRHAVREAENGICTDILEDVIEANILLSGLGFENTGCSVAHAIASGLSVIKDADSYLHGEKVAFGTLVQLFAEGYSFVEREELCRLLVDLGLPVTLGDLHVGKDETTIRAIAEKSILDFGPVSKLMDVEDLCQCIISASVYGEMFTAE
jgi:glycerol dehydrogenase